MKNDILRADSILHSRASISTSIRTFAFIYLLIIGQTLPTNAQITIDATSVVRARFGAEVDPHDPNNVLFGLQSLSADITVSPHFPVTIPASFTGLASNSWSNALNWNGRYIAITGGTIVKDLASTGTKGGVLPLAVVAIEDVYDALTNGGPTEKSVTSKIATLKWQSSSLSPLNASANLTASLDVKFDVTIPEGKTVTMDQSPIVLESLLVNPGANLAANTSLRTRNDLDNHGSITGLGAIIQGDFANDGNVSVTGTLALNGTFSNTGTVILQQTANFSRPGPISNHGTIGLNGATLSGYAVNEYSLLRGWGTVNSDLNVFSTVSADESGKTLTLGGSGSTSIANEGMLKATNGGRLYFANATVYQNLGSSISANDGVVDFNYATINNGAINASGTGYAQVSYSCVMTNVTNSAPLRIMSGHGGLSVRGGSFENNDLITVNYNGGTGANLRFDAPTALSGGGSIFLNNGLLSGDPITIAPGQQPIRGWGAIEANLTFSSTVSADVDGKSLTFGSSNKSIILNNSGRIEATNGGRLYFANATVNQNPGSSISANDGVVDFNYATINNGAISASGTGYTQVSYSCVMTNVTNNAPLRIMSGHGGLSVRGGSFENNGLITVNYNGGTGANLRFDAPTALSGGGSILLNNGLLSGDPITIAPGQQPIRGWGAIEANLTFSSTVSADVDGKSLTFGSSNKSIILNNSGRIEATNGGTLYFAHATVNQGGGGAVSASGGNVDFYYATINGGSINASAGSHARVSYSCVLNNVTNNAPLRIMSGHGGLSVRGGSFENNGLITVNYNGGTGANLRFDSPTALSGSGSIFLNNGLLSGDPITIAPGQQTIRGWGVIEANLTFSSSVSTDVNGKTLTFGSSNRPVILNNSGRIEATNGGMLYFAQATVNQGGGGVISADGGNVDFYYATINGGSINASAGSHAQVSYSCVLNNVTNNAPLRIMSGHGGVSVRGGSFKNNNLITVNYNGGTGANLRFDAPTALSGGGTISVMDKGQLTGESITVGAFQRISGVGLIDTEILNFGTISPGVSIGSLSFRKRFTAMPGSRIEIQIGGSSAENGYDRFLSTGAASLGGNLIVSVFEEFRSLITAENSFRVIQCNGGVSGAFENAKNGARVQSNYGTFLVSIDATGVSLSDFRPDPTWHDDHFTPSELLDSSISGDSSDPNANGLSNLLEYAMDLDPRSGAMPQFPSFSIDGEYIFITYQRSNRASDVLISLESSSDLTEWVLINAIEEIMESGLKSDVVRVKVPIEDSERLFFRMEAARM